MLSILAWLVKIYNQLSDLIKIVTDMQATITAIKNNTDQIIQAQNSQGIEIATIQDEFAAIKKVLGIGVPIQETIVWGPPKP